MSGRGSDSFQWLVCYFNWCQGYFYNVRKVHTHTKKKKTDLSRERKEKKKHNSEKIHTFTHTHKKKKDRGAQGPINLGKA